MPLCGSIYLKSVEKGNVQAFERHILNIAGCLQEFFEVAQRYLPIFYGPDGVSVANHVLDLVHELLKFRYDQMLGSCRYHQFILDGLGRNELSGKH